MIDYPAPFGWLKLDELNKNPQKFPNEAVASNFPLFFQLTAAAIVMLLDKNVATYSLVESLLFGSTTPSNRKPAPPLDQLDINRPTTIYRVLNNPEKLQEAISTIKVGIETENPIYENDAVTEDDGYKLKVGILDYMSDAPTMLIDCSLTYITVDHLRKDKEQPRPKLPFGLLHEHLSALSVIERLSVLVASLNNDDLDCAQEQYKKCLNLLQTHALTSYLLQGVELDKLSGDELLNVGSKLHLYPAHLKGLPKSPQLLSKHDDALHFINWMYRSYLEYQKLYASLKGNKSSQEKSRKDRDHIKRLALPLLMEELPKNIIRWESPKKACKALLHQLVTELKKSPIVSMTKGEKTSITDKTFTEILTEMALEYPDLFDEQPNKK